MALPYGGTIVSNYHKAREKGYAFADDLVLAIEASVPVGLTEYERACWMHDAYGAAAASINGEERDAFQAAGRAFAARNAA